MGHRGYTNRAKSGDRASVAHQRQRSAQASLSKQRARSRSKTSKERPKPTIVIEPCEPQASEEDRGQDEVDSSSSTRPST
jgi:hypothetical protein